MAMPTGASKVQRQLARAHTGLTADQKRLERAATTAEAAGRDAAASRARKRIGIVKRCLSTVRRHRQRVRRGGTDAVDDAKDALEEVQEARDPVAAIVRRARGSTMKRNPYTGFETGDYNRRRASSPQEARQMAASREAERKRRGLEYRVSKILGKQRKTRRNPFGPLRGMRNWSAGEWIGLGVYGAVVYALGRVASR